MSFMARPNGWFLRLVLSLACLGPLVGCDREARETACGPERSFATIPAGTISIDNQRYDIEAFRMVAIEVTNARFQAFVDETGYVTVAERLDQDGNKFGSAVFTDPKDGNGYWWRLDRSANWRQPEGAGSDISERMSHPVVHMAYDDVVAFARWAGGVLPTEAQWEYAARQGLADAPYEFGDSRPGPDQANTWQGVFPLANLGKDGFLRTAPVGCFPANAYGLHDMTGNVWEWVAHNSDKTGQANGLLAGGSFLCSDNYCRNYQPSGRQLQELDFSASHIGFRLVYPNEAGTGG